MSNQRLMKVKEKAGDGYAKTNAIAPPPHGNSEMPASDPSPTHRTGSNQTPRYFAGYKIKIPNACIGLGLRCMNPYDMVRHERARFVPGAVGQAV